MIRAGGIKVPLDFDFSQLEAFCARKLRIGAEHLKNVQLVKKSVDARKKADVHFIISVDIESDCEDKLLKMNKNAVRVEPYSYKVRKIAESTVRPVVIGFGPAGMFAALVLAMAGVRPIVLERGADVDTRCEAVDKFRSEGILDPECNVQFGEGGAGTFSDGKLTTGIKDRRIRFILEMFVEFGAPDEILYMAKPHIGTDKLRAVVKNLRKRVISLGGEVRFSSRFTGFDAEGGTISAVRFEDAEGVHTIAAENVILAAGHSARDVFELLSDKNVEMSRKSFAVGVRIEHLRRDIDRAMYGDFADSPHLKSADYKLAVHLPSGRALYTFCMCPGGYVMAASSEEGRLAVNGMSLFARDAENSNSALLVNIDPDDLEGDDVLAGVRFQRDIEEKAFAAGGSDYSAPVATVGAFLRGKEEGLGRVTPSYRPNYRFAMPESYLPDFVCDALRDGIVEMGRKIRGFDDDEAVLTGVESRSSSPVRVNRDAEDMQSISLRGLFPCGEGAGYAGGIVSAAVDGIKCAEKIIDILSEGGNA